MRRMLSQSWRGPSRGLCKAPICQRTHISLGASLRKHDVQFTVRTGRLMCTDSMADEYGDMDSSGLTYKRSHYKLENGEELPEVQVRYKVFGELNESRDNVMVVCHAFTGSACLNDWWGSMLGPGLPFDTDKYLVVCANVLGSCYGSTGPQSIDPRTGKMYGNSFPNVTIRDTVGLHMEILKEGMGVKSVHAVIGGSLGGMQALEWAVMGDGFVKNAIVIGCGAQHDAWQIAISEVQRQAIYADDKWNNGDVDMDDPPKKGVALARQMAMVSYRTASAYNNKFARSIRTKNLDERKEKMEGGEAWEVKGYLEYQGIKFQNRFDPVTYIKLTHKMDTHDVGRGRGGAQQALADIKARVMIVGIDSDVLYPLPMQQELHSLIPTSILRTIRSDEGHDGFLLAQDVLGKYIEEFL